MSSIFSRSGRRQVGEFAHANVVVVFDFDGTLAPIVSSPAAARMRASTRRLIDELTGYYPCAVVSGRSRADLARKLSGVRVDCLLGNHGLELGRVNGDWKSKRAVIRSWATSLRRIAAAFPGATVEDKGASVTVHFRNARDRDGARRATRAAAGRLDGARLVTGREAINVLPREGVSKTQVICRVRELFGCDACIYAGDGDGDDDVFAIDEAYSLLPIRVGARRGRARWSLHGQRDVDSLLRLLISARRSSLSGVMAR